MNASKQALSLFITLFGLAFSGWYFASSPIEFRLDRNTLDTTIDAMAFNLKVKQFDTDGKITSIIEAPKMHHIPKNNQHFMHNPHIKLSQTNKPDWDIVSNKAVSIKGGKKITFLNNVIIHQNKSEQSEESTLKTEVLYYKPKSKYAWTQEKVIFEQAGNVVESKGMKAFLEEKHIQLLSEARATYAPNQG